MVKIVHIEKLKINCCLGKPALICGSVLFFLEYLPNRRKLTEVSHCDLISSDLPSWIEIYNFVIGETPAS